MKKHILILFIVSVTCLLANNFSDKDYYDFEENGYFENPKSVVGGTVFTDNHSSKIYFSHNGQTETIIASPGCGRYYTISNDKNLIGFKSIDKITGLQSPAIYDISQKKIISLHKPVNQSGQVSFSKSGAIAFTIDRFLYILKNGKTKKIKLKSYSNIAPISPDEKYVFYKDKKERMHLLNLETNEDKTITPENEAYYAGSWSPNSKSVIIYDIGGYIYFYNIISGELINLNAYGKADWISNDKIIYNSTVVKDFDIKSSDIFIYSILDGNITNLTQTDNIYEMNPSFTKDKIVFDTWQKKQIFSANLINNRILNKEIIYQTQDKLDINYYNLTNDNSSKVNISIPYIHQVYDNWNSYGHKYGCCAAATGLMAIMYYKTFPHWDTTCSSPTSHVSHWGMYIGNLYNYRGTTYSVESQSWSNGGIDDYDWADGGSPNSRMRQMIENHGLTSAQHWTSNVTYSMISGDVTAGYPYPVCVMLTTSGHLILAKGIHDDAKMQLIYHDPYGDKNTAGYPSYDGDDTVYDWPGESNGIVNLSSMAWSVSAHNTHQSVPTADIDDLQFAYNISDYDDYQNSNIGFFLYTGGTGGMKYWRGETGGANDNYWWTGAMTATTSDDYYASWRPNIVTTGDYEISVYIPNAISATTNARYQVHDATGTHLVTLDQSANTGSWASLGTFTFNNDNSGYLYLGDGCGTKSGSFSKDDIRADKVLFDEVKFEQTTGDVVIYDNDFETNDGGLVSGTSEWEHGIDGSAGAFSGNYVWGTVCGNDYGNTVNDTLDLSVTLTTNCKLTFKHWYQIESTKAIVYDGGNVKISDDGGATFNVIAPEAGYADTVNSTYSNPLGGEPAYSGTSSGWETATFDLSAYDNESVIIRWNFGSDGATPDKGWYIDDVNVTSYHEEAPLPVTLSAFMAKYQGKAMLYWETQSETNNSKWNIYRSVSSNFGQAEKITSLPGAGTTTQTTSYHYNDNSELSYGASYWYCLESVDFTGNTYLSFPQKIIVEDNQNNVPEGTLATKLIKNYPNPFNPSTQIIYSLDKPQKVVISIYNLKGEKMITLINSMRDKGKHHVLWNGKDKYGKSSSSGIYFYRMTTGKKTFTKKMIMME